MTAKNKLKPVRKSKVGKWPRRLKWTLLILAIGLGTFRESDYTVSRLYYIPWGIGPNDVIPPGVEKISFKSLDGTPITGWFIHGKSPLASQRPALLYLHGNAGNLPVQYSQIGFLPDWGYDIFAVDFRGFGDSQGHPSRKGLWEDTQAAFQELTLLAPGRKYGVVGFSMGAAYATLLAAHEPRVSAAAYIGCFTTFREIGSYTLKTWGFPGWTTPFLAWLLVPNGLDPLDAVGGPDHPRGLFVHGTADGNIPYLMGQELDQYYHGPKELLIMPGYGHGDYFKGPLAGEFHQAFDRLFLKGGRG